MKVNGPRALIKKLEEASLNSGLIEVIHLNEVPSQFALVLAAGNGRRREDGSRQPLDFKAGDMVIVKSFCGTPVPWKDEDCFMVMEEDVLAVCQ